MTIKHQSAPSHSSDRIERVSGHKRYPNLSAFTVHEFRTPLTVTLGYLRMLLKSGTITDQQRQLLELTHKSCARLSELVEELSVVSNLEAGSLTFNRNSTDVRSALRAAVTRLTPLPDREVPIEIAIGEEAVPIDGDPVRLSAAFAAIAVELRRELIGGEPLIVRDRVAEGAYEVTIGYPDLLADIDADADLPVFDEWRGGAGLSLVIARRVLEQHGGRIYNGPGERKSSVRITIPLS